MVVNSTIEEQPEWEYVNSFWKILEEGHEDGLSLPWICDAFDFDSVNGNVTFMTRILTTHPKVLPISISSDAQLGATTLLPGRNLVEVY